MKSLERDPCLYWNLAYETRGFQLDGENGGRLLDFKKKKSQQQQQYRSLPLNNNDIML